ncbi:helix-turn-helix domain-containing protein [Aurantimicrobium minutum]|uniref:helix-turn-helix domain-containing protein n=1 Tax=Aurantimicrobium minutum TaxID=708131 RepID=UPI00248E7D8D|nr:helix-turn-helix transcriptional regulator [Aurantimicrobium minutum]
MTAYLVMPTERIRTARERRGIGVRALARIAGVTPGAVTQWEKSEAQGTLRESTLHRVLAALGTTLEAEFPPPSNSALDRREDRVALELHRAVAAKLVMNPEAVLSVVPENIRSMRSRVQGNASQAVLDRWESLVRSRQIGALVDQMLSTDSVAVSMRQSSPFMGVLTSQEREEAIDRAVVLSVSKTSSSPAG